MALEFSAANGDLQIVSAENRSLGLWGEETRAWVCEKACTGGEKSDTILEQFSKSMGTARKQIDPL